MIHQFENKYMMTKQDQPKPEKQEKIKPDVAAGLLLQAHLKISDPKTGQILLKTRG